MQKFTHLNVHSGFSIIDGVMSPKEIVKKAKDMGMESVAITDYSSMYSAIEFYETAKSEGIKPILGIDVNIVPEYKFKEVKSGSKTLSVLDIDDAYRAKLYARNNEGYTYLMEILSEGYMRGLYHKGRHNLPYVEEKDIIERSGGLIMLSNMEDGKAGQSIIEKDFEKSKEAMLFWKNVFKDRYFTEIARTGRKVEDEYIPLAVKLSIDLDIPIVATNNVRFSTQDDFKTHEIRVAIQEKENIDARGFNTPYSPHQYFKTQEEMEELFYDIPEALENAQAIAEHCNIELDLNKPALPRFPTPHGETEADYLKAMAEEGLEKRLVSVLENIETNEEKEKTRKEYEERLQAELDVINGMGFPGYFLIVAEFIKWSKRNDIPVGPGRGSGAGSLVAYSCDITDIDPMPYDLLFERFLNPERVSMPDFDIDFCIEGRDRVIEYVSQRYGKDAVSQIATFGKMAARSAIKDVVRVTGNPFSLGERLVKMIPKDLDITIEKAIARSDFFRNEYEQNPDSKAIIDTAMALEGVPRSIGRHAGGVLISPSKLSDFTPVHFDGESVASQYDKDDVETAGLVKFDFLGLKNLTVIDKAVKKINKRREMEGGNPLDISKIPMSDIKAFDLLKEGNTTAVFQLESNGMKGVMKKLQPDNFEDIIALVALYRPGPLQSGMVEDFIDRKHGRKVVEYPHPCLEEVLKPTYGVIVYQEQVMQIAQRMAGYSLGQADLLRRAMGKKKPEEMAKQKTIFIEGSAKNGIDKEKAEEVFELIDYFSGYGFNKSHSAAYALVSYQTAYLKSHYPSEFMAAVMSSDMAKTEKLVNYFADFETNGGKVIPPNINISDKMFLPTKKGNILFGLNAIKGVGETVCDEIIRARNEGGKFTDVYDFVERTSSKVNKTAMTGLINAGALDPFNIDRAILLENVESFGKWRTKFKNAKEPGELERPELITAPPINHKDKLDNEVLSMGVYLSGHPMDEYKEEMSSVPTCRNIDINLDEHGYTEKEKKYFSQIGVVTSVEKKKGMVFFTLDDTTGVIKCNMFKGVANKYGERINVGSVILAKGRLAEDNYTEEPAISVKEILSIQEIREKHARQLVIYDDNDLLSDKKITSTVKDKVIENSPGYSKLFIVGNKDGSEVQIDLKTADSVVPNEAFVQELNNMGLRTKIFYDGNELDFRSLKKTFHGEEQHYSKEEIVGKVKDNMQRLKLLLDEAGVEKGEQVRKGSLKRSREISMR
jgi:DNA polymerase-3 subunit alpha